MTYHQLGNPEFFCDYPNIRRITENVSIMECGIQCNQNPRCVMFATDDRQCVITEYNGGDPGTKEAFLMYKQWWMVDAAINTL